MRRREFIAGLGTAAAWPLAARAQQPAVPVIGFVSYGVSEAPNSKNAASAFLQGLKEIGYDDGRNVAIEYRWAEFREDQLQTMVADLVQRRVSLIAAIGVPNLAIVAKSTTATIPIVFANGADPVKLGLVANLNRPGGNVTGVSFLVSALASKRLGLLHQSIPTAKVIGFLVDPTHPIAESETSDMQTAAEALGLKLLIVRASTASEVDAAITTLVQQRGDALIVAAEGFFASRRDQLAALVTRHAIPAMFDSPGYVQAGGLMSYGTNIADAFRQAGIYSGRILKGARPADLPVQQSTRFRFVINLKTAKALSLDIPAGVLAIADEVIE
jgi:putative ABC transport system substrate-binding protein